MKNHEWRDGQLLQTNKKWSQLKMSQRAWILEATRAGPAAYVEQHGTLPMKKKKEAVLDAVYEKINERGIWIPYGEFKREANKCIDRQNRKSPLRVPSQKEQYQKKSTVMESERLILRKMTLQDFEDIKAMLADPEVMYAWEKTFTDEEIRQWIERQKKRYRKERVGYFLAVDKASGTVVGQIGLMYNHIDGRQRLEVGYILKKEFLHMGYAQEGAKCCIEYAFTQMNKGRVYATIRPENTASVAVAESIGMRRIGEYVKKVDGKEMPHSIYVVDRA